MKKRLLIRKKQALLFYSLCFMLLCANVIQAQDVYTWVPGTTGNWSTAASWTKVGTTTTNTTPGGAGGGGDIVVINNGTCALDVDAAIARLTVGSLATPAQGILNISATKTLAITNIASNAPTTSAIILAGGKINNTGTLTVTASATTGTTTPITVNSPPNLTPGLDWGYGGSGVLSVASTSTAPTPAATIISVNNTLLTAEVPVFTFNNPTFTLANNFYVVTAAGLSRIKIGGSLTINPSSINNGFLNSNNGTVDVLAGATITVASNNASTAGSHAMQFNGGILNNYGSITCTGNTVSTMRFQGNTPVTCAFNNFGTYSSDTKGFGFYSNSGSAVSITIDNKSTGVIVIKNSSAQSIRLQMAATKYFIINSGTMNLTGGGSTPAAANNEIFSKLSPDQSSLTNSGTITSNNVFTQFNPIVSFQDAANTVTLNLHSLVNGNIISFLSVATTTGIAINTPYYVVGATANTFQVATTLSGSPIDLVTDGTGGVLYVAPLLINNTGTINYTPNITITQTALTAFAATDTNVSASKSFVVAGTNLTANLAVGFNPASTDYEFSTDDFVTAGVSSLSLTPTSGTVASTTVYVRLKAAASAVSPSATVAITSASATTRTIALSGVITLKTIDNAVSGFALYPNPSKSNSFNVVIPQSMSKASLTVSNLLGQKLFSQDDLQSGATERVTVDNVNTAGVYLVRLTSEGKTATTKWIVQ